MDASERILSTTNILVHVIILFSFLSIFFFFYISKIESNAFKEELGGMITKNINKLVDSYPEIIPTLGELNPYMIKFMKKYESESQATIEHNIMLKFSSVFLVLIFLGILITIIVTLKFECGKKTNIGSILAQNVVIFIFIGMVEYTFFTKVASKYIPVVPSLMIDTIIESLKERMKN